MMKPLGHRLVLLAPMKIHVLGWIGQLPSSPFPSERVNIIPEGTSISGRDGSFPSGSQGQ